MTSESPPKGTEDERNAGEAQPEAGNQAVRREDVAEAPAAAAAAATPTAAAASSAAAPAEAPSEAPAASKAPSAPAKIAPWRKPGPNKKSYMPTFAAPEAYGKKADPKYAQMRKDAEEHVVKEKAKKERAKERARRKKKGGKGEEQVQVAEDNSEACQLFFLIALGVATALFEALDTDVLLGILFMPIMSVMKFFSAEFDNAMLDPNYWSTMMGEAYNSMCTEAPGIFIAFVFTMFAIGVTYFLFEADISKWWRERHLRNQGYDALEEEDEDTLSDESLEAIFAEIDTNGGGDIERDEMSIAIEKLFGKLEPELVDQMMKAGDTDNDGDVDLDEFKMVMRKGAEMGIAAVTKVTKAMTDVDEMQVSLRNAREALEELDLIMRLRGEGAEPEIKKELNAKHKKLEDQISTLQGFLAAVETEQAEEVDLEAAAAAEAEAEAQKARAGSCGEMTKTAVGILKNTISGVLTIYLYFMDLSSDYAVTMLFYNTGALRFSFVSACLLVGQFAVVWLRVLPYLHVTYGPQSTFYRLFLFFGMPFGCFFFDALMFLGPFGLLPIVPLPESMRLFIPACACLRIEPTDIKIVATQLPFSDSRAFDYDGQMRRRV